MKDREAPHAGFPTKDDNMDTSPHPLPLESLQRETLDFNPFFHSISQEIHLPFTFEDYKLSAQHQASLLHEYTHLVQALSTTYGVYGFIGLSERLVFFFNAIQGRLELSFPILEWASQEAGDETLSAYSQYERHYRSQRVSGDGSWNIEVTSDADDFSLRQESRTVGGNYLNRWHIIRKIGASAVAIPLLGICLSEAQAECVATYFQGIPSILFEQEGRESSAKQLVYTSVNGLVRRLLPNYPTLETTYLLTEYALMTFVPDVAFVEGIEFLKGRPPPVTLSEWRTTWEELETSLGYQKQSVTNLLLEIQRKISVFSKHAGNMIMDLLVQRLEMSRSLVLLKKSNPFQFFPWARTMEWFEQELLVHIPVAAAHFADRIYVLGSPTHAHNQTQTALNAVAFLLAVLEGTKSAECPRFQSTSCTAERTLECKQFPWARGDVGGGRMCAQGALGKILGISESSLSAVAERYKP